MATQYIINEKGEKTSVIIPINEYENLIHQNHLHLELTDEYKTMMDGMLDDKSQDTVAYVSLDVIKSRFKE